MTKKEKTKKRAYRRGSIRPAGWGGTAFIPKRVKFNGLIYSQHSIHDTKAQANSEATRVRSDGKNARVRLYQAMYWTVFSRNRKH